LEEALEYQMHHIPFRKYKMLASWVGQALIRQGKCCYQINIPNIANRQATTLSSVPIPQAGQENSKKIMLLMCTIALVRTITY